MPSLLALTTPPQRRGPRAFRSFRQGNLFVSGAPGRDLVAEVNLSNLSDGGGEECGLSYRLLTDKRDLWAAYIDTGDNLLHLSKFASGVEYSVATASWTYAATAELRVIAQYNRHRVWVDGVLRIDVRDGTMNTGTGVGLFNRSTTAVLFDDAYAEAL